MKSFTTICFLILAATTTFDYRQAYADNFSKRIDSILNNSCGRDASSSVLFKILGSGKVLYSKNPDQPLIPASNMKIITTIAAIKILKPWFTFDTVFAHTGRRSGEAIEGDLVIIGRGNPHLVSEDLWLMANALRKRGIRRITGDLVLDDSYFDEERYPPGWRHSKHRRAFYAPTGALSLNFNSVSISIYPPSYESEKAVVAIDPRSPYIKLVNSLRTDTGGDTSITIDMKKGKNGSEKIIVGGRVAVGSKELNYYRHISDPIRYFGLTFIEFMKDAGIKIDGRIVHAQPMTRKPQAEEIFTYPSRPLLYDLDDMNKFSNNFMAEQIVKTIGAEAVSNPGSFEKGLKKIEELLISWNLKSGSFHLADGSGLSRENRISSSLLVEILERSHGEWEGGPEFLTSLAMMGKEGSVKGRLSSTEKYIRVKTGTLKSVSSLSGYFPLNSGEIAVFSMILNGFSCHNGDMLVVQNSILRELARYNAE